MNRILKVVSQVCSVAVILNSVGCASTDSIEPETATLSFAFAPSTQGTQSFTTEENLNWRIEKASLLAGEIGIHWDRELRGGVAAGIVAPRHDVSGKISPKLYGYYAINLLDTNRLQTLSIDPKHYDHIHMVSLPADSITTADTVVTGAEFPELAEASLFISGTVSNGSDTIPFEFLTSTVYGENDLGDILLDLSIYENDHYTVFIEADFEEWFSVVSWEQLAGTELIRISETTNSIAYFNIETSFTADNAFLYRFQKEQ